VAVREYKAGIAITGRARIVAGCSVPPGVGGLEGITFLGCTFQSASRATRQYAPVGSDDVHSFCAALDK
jgi:hypothetical protein